MRFAYRTLLALPLVMAHAATLSPVAPPVTLPFDAARKSPAQYQHGYFVSYDVATSGVWCFDRKGAPVTVVQIDNLGASGSRVQLRHAAVGPGGTLAVTGSAYSHEGALVPFIAWIRPGGEVSRVVRNAPFAAANLVFAGDGSLWAFGRQRDGQYRDVPSHDVIRHYDADGKLLASMIRNDSFATAGKYPPAYQAAMASAGGRVGILSFTASEWIEVDANGSLAGRWRISGLSAFEGPLAVAMTPDGVFLSLFKGDGPASVYRLNKSTGSLEQVSSAPASHVGGADGSQLVLITGAEAVWTERK